MSAKQGSWFLKQGSITEPFLFHIVDFNFFVSPTNNIYLFQMLCISVVSDPVDMGLYTIKKFHFIKFIGVMEIKTQG